MDHNFVIFYDKFPLMRNITFSFFLAGIIVFSANAQHSLFENWSAGINAGLYGIGVQGAASLSPNLKLRAGFDYFTYSHNEAIEFEVTVTQNGYETDAQAELTDTEVTFPNFKTLVDYYPMKNGIFCFTGGLYFGANKASTNGLIKNYQELSVALGEKPELRYEDIVITPNDDGSFSGQLDMGNAIKPYLGIGLGRTIPHNRVGFKFELGVVYQGKYDLISPNLNETGDNWINAITEDLDLPVSESIFNWWPMMNFSLTYRIR